MRCRMYDFVYTTDLGVNLLVLDHEEPRTNQDMDMMDYQGFRFQSHLNKEGYLETLLDISSPELNEPILQPGVRSMDMETTLLDINSPELNEPILQPGVNSMVMKNPEIDRTRDGSNFTKTDDFKRIDKFRRIDEFRRTDYFRRTGDFRRADDNPDRIDDFSHTSNLYKCTKIISGRQSSNLLLFLDQNQIVGFIHCREGEELSPNIQKFLAEKNKNAVLMSLGSLIQTEDFPDDFI